MEVKFYEDTEDRLLEFAVIISKYRGRWVFCKHKDRNTYEISGGHREENESILNTAKRELYEETGATDFSIKKYAYTPSSAKQESTNRVKNRSVCFTMPI